MTEPGTTSRDLATLLLDSMDVYDTAKCRYDAAFVARAGQYGEGRRTAGAEEDLRAAQQQLDLQRQFVIRSMSDIIERLSRPAAEDGARALPGSSAQSDRCAHERRSRAVPMSHCYGCGHFIIEEAAASSDPWHGFPIGHWCAVMGSIGRGDEPTPEDIHAIEQWRKEKLAKQPSPLVICPFCHADFNVSHACFAAQQRVQDTDVYEFPVNESCGQCPHRRGHHEENEQGKCTKCNCAKWIPVVIVDEEVCIQKLAALKEERDEIDGRRILNLNALHAQQAKVSALTGALRKIADGEIQTPYGTGIGYLRDIARRALSEIGAAEQNKA